MSTVTSTQAVSSNGSTTTATASKTLDKDAFLNLLVAQLKNQDPTQAQDPNAMVQEMTSFSTLEQMQNMNTLLAGIQVQNQGIFQAQAANLVGKQVKVSGAAFNLKDGKGSMTVTLPSDAKVSLVIKDSTGKVVKTIDEGSLTSGDHTLTWDGKDDQGNQLADGSYSVTVNATDSNGKSVTATSSSYIKVDAVLFKDGTVYILSGGKQYSLSDVSEVSA